ncbi:MAG TPA: cbb3-type cytochrome c oxidase subunit I [Chitinophagaceae bacterium]|jgi:cytochrome c oxidase subunit 1|nr:cbb3-type cytochrome c oxidase subunit I [Chitinophagaceae bacterium]HNF45430.1 cbb3-type cytochrome c oxidase subunit I [Chitinophagaceae bacterium]HNJ54805.1 cbb3-type cytochrome c oxidase subunit I [Chitinophagaceae bacterium]HNL58550.1 cbb3-type cytochrome c oxidase subunit I [Chitinophagaceae bacterium]HNN98732.1 cbb3-type cytochrome c oxidase subunit I [Chitinophagaceae bacterium]
MSDTTLHLHPEVASHDVYEEEHHGHKETFISKYVFSMDHKTISKQFLITGIFWAIIGGFFSVLFRLQLGFPDQSFPFLETLFGHWAQGGKISPEFYYGLITMHGTILVFFVLTAGLSGTYANLLIPLQIGARDMASPFLNMLSYWFFFLAGCIMLASLFISTGPAAGGWTIYPPLSALGEASIGSKLGMDLWLVSMAFFIVSSLLGGLNYISTILNMRTKGMTMTRMPLTMWAILFTAILGVLSFPVLLSGAILLLFDRNLGTSFFLSDIYIAGQALPNEGGSAILFQHLFWFLGHPEVYIIILPAMGIVSEILAISSRKPIFGYTAMVGSLFAITILAFLVWAHHMFVTGLNPFLGSVFTLLTLLIAVPSSIKVFNWLTTLWRGNIKFTPASLFSIGFVSMFISGGLTGIFLGNSAIDIHLHDTMFNIAHFHLVMGVAAFFAMFAGIYHWFPVMFGRYMNNTLGYIHFWITMIGAYLIFWPMHYQGFAGMPRRYLDKSSWASFSQFHELDKMITVVTIIVFAVQLMFVFNFFYSIYKGRKVTKQNPWGATTLEWTTPIRPGHGNWDGEIPEVHRWPYDFGKDGREFIPQTEPIGEKESKH